MKNFPFYGHAVLFDFRPVYVYISARKKAQRTELSNKWVFNEFQCRMVTRHGHIQY